MQTASFEHRNSRCMIIKHVQNDLEAVVHALINAQIVELLDDLQCIASDRCF